jgi:hypothetical protein
VSHAVFTVEKIDGVRDKASEDTTTVEVQTFLKTFLNMLPRFVYFTDKAFFWQKADFLVLGLWSSSVRLSGVLDYQMTQ